MRREESIKLKHLIIGIGNPLRGDDRVGWYIIERLSQEINRESELPPLEFRTYMELPIELADELKDYEVVIFVDSWVTDTEGDVQLIELEAVEEVLLSGSHMLTPVDILSIARALNEKLPKVYLLRVRGEKFPFSEELSKETRERAEKGIDILLRFLSSSRECKTSYK